MCSRYFLDDDGNIIAYTFKVPVHDGIRRRSNIAPTQQAPVIRTAPGGGREVAMLRWGLVPFWAKDLAIGSKLINARSETLREKPAFRSAFKSRRCVVPASGFFEWTGEARHRVPHAITIEGQALMSFAGLWESWNDAQGQPIETYTIVTTAANPFMSAMHERMPAILALADIETWMSGSADDAWGVIRPHADEGMRERLLDPKALEPQRPPRTDSDDSGQKSLF